MFIAIIRCNVFIYEKITENKNEIKDSSRIVYVFEKTEIFSKSYYIQFFYECIQRGDQITLFHS